MTPSPTVSAAHVAAAAEIVPTRSVFPADQPVDIEVRGLAGAGELSVWHLGDPLGTVAVAGDGPVTVGRLAPGGYGFELRTTGTVLRTAAEVSDRPRSRLRYGFVADYAPGRDVAAVVANAQRLHLTGVQFYDWAFRHADLLGTGESYRDPLDRLVTKQTVRDLVHGLRAIGTDALGYAAVYGVGAGEWQRWRHLALLRSDGEPYRLGDLLSLIDPGAQQWIDHLGAELAAAVGLLGFDGFHLDQYGYPRRAVRADGADVDMAESFVRLIEGVRRATPDARLVFNNVNDFPTWATAGAAQDAVYIEVWPPHVTLGSLAAVVRRARAAGGDRPVVVAAYQQVYDSAPASSADLATAFTMATLYSHGATQLLAGEADRILVDPYYPRNHTVEPSTAELLRRWYDFLVEHDELLMDPAAVDVTGAYSGAYNDVLEVDFGATPLTGEPAAGGLWMRVVQVGDRLVIHLINLAGQDDTLWDAPRRRPSAVGRGRLRVRRVGSAVPRVRVADPDRQARLVDVGVLTDGEHAVAALPEPQVWLTVVVDLVPAGPRADDAGGVA